jgi:hypothetical protein
VWKTHSNERSDAFNGLESLELRWAGIKWLTVACIAMRVAELL